MSLSLSPIACCFYDSLELTFDFFRLHIAMTILRQSLSLCCCLLLSTPVGRQKFHFVVFIVHFQRKKKHLTWLWSRNDWLICYAICFIIYLLSLARMCRILPIKSTDLILYVELYTIRNGWMDGWWISAVMQCRDDDDTIFMTWILN